MPAQAPESTKTTKIVAGFIAAIALLLIFTWVVGWESILQAISRANTGMILLGMVISFSNLLFLGIAWWIIVQDVAGFGLIEGIEVFLATQFANAVTPLGQLGGEPFIAYILSRDADIAIEEAFGATLIADLINTVPFFTLSILGIVVYLVFFPLNETVSLILKIISALVLVIGVTFIIIWKQEQKTVALFGRAGMGFKRLINLLGMGEEEIRREKMMHRGQTFYTVLQETMKKRRLAVRALVFAHVANIIWFIGLYLIILSLGFDPPISAIFFIVPAASLAGYLPLPGGLGGIEIALTVLLITVAGVPGAIASAAVLTFRASTYWASIVVGGYYSSRLSIDILSEL